MDDRTHKPTKLSRFQSAAILGLALLCWLARISPPRGSATLELDPSYQQALGVALTHGLRFGREIVFTSGPLAYFTASPFDPQLYAAKLWLWEVLLGAAVAWFLFARLVRRGTWIDVATGVLILTVLPMPDDAWLFAMGLLAADLGLECLEQTPDGRARWLWGLRGFVALLLLSILTLIKVTSMTFAFAAFAILLLRATSKQGPRTAAAWFAAFVCVQALLWLGIGQRLLDLPVYFWSSIELASGFDAAMSNQPTTLALGLGIPCLLLGIAVCLWHAKLPWGGERTEKIDAARAQALLVAAALVLAYKAGFARASDHIVTFFSTAMIAPLFLIPFERARVAGTAWRQARLRCSVACLTAVCALATSTMDIQAPSTIVAAFSRRVRQSTAWLSHPGETLATLQRARAKIQQDCALPRIQSIVGSRSISAFSLGDCLLFLEGLNWRPRPVFQSFSVFTQATAQANAAFLDGERGPDFILLRGDWIDRRLPASEDPLSVQVLLRVFRPRANEGGFLLLERAQVGEPKARSLVQSGQVEWGERVALPQGDQPLVINARIQSSIFGRLRAALFQTPEVEVEVELQSGESSVHRIAPFALACGVVLRPWLPTKEAWMVAARGLTEDAPVALRFKTSGQTSFAPRIGFEFLLAPDLRAPNLDPALERELVLGAAGDLPLAFESPKPPELTGWSAAPVMLLVQAPASLSFAAGQGPARLQAKLRVPPWIASAPNFSNLRLLVYAKEGDSARECARFDVGPTGIDAVSSSFALDVQTDFAAAGTWIFVIRSQPNADQATARIGIFDLRVNR